MAVEANSQFSLGFGQSSTQDFSLFLDGLFKFVLEGSTRIDVSGQIVLEGNLEGSSAIKPSIGSTFFLLRNDGIDPVVGTFAGLPEGAPVRFSGYEFTISYKANGDGGEVGNDVALVTTVPEPSSLIQAISLLGYAAFARRFRFPKWC